MYTPLHTHSTFSFHAGTASVPELVSRAKALGLSALALTDTDRMSALIQFYCACKQNDIKPLLGVELTEPANPCEHIVCLAKNADGYSDICEIITQRHLNPNFRYRDIFLKPWPNLIVFSSFPHLLQFLAHTPNRENLYAELINNSERTRVRSREVEVVARQLKIPLIASNNAFFIDRNDWEVHKVLRAIGLNATLSRLKNHEFESPRAYLRGHKEMTRLFPNHRQALANTTKIAHSCTVELKLNQWILPKIDVPTGYTPTSYLQKLATKGLTENYAGKPEFEQAKQLQERELATIDTLGYSSYFLIVKDIRDWANRRFSKNYRKPRDSTILRGSAANAITFYNLGVSDLDPIRYNLYFQRFLNEDRASPPDADLDFGWDERDEALDYMIDRWGRDRVAITCTTNHFRRRAAFRETAKVFGYTEEEITKILKSHRTASRRIEDTEIDRIVAFSERIRGKPRFLGQHPGGVLVTNDPIYRRVACERSGGEKNRIITQIDMHNGIDELGLIKFDLLGNGSLSVLRDTLAQLSEQNLADPRVNDLEKCYHDPLVKDILKKGRTRGIFYIESPAQTRLNKKAHVETFEEVTITSSLIRPAGTGYTKTFIERHRKAKQGIFDWQFVHPSLEPILGETHDVCAFQEDVTKICHHIAGLSYKKADKIRKMMNSLHEGAVPVEQWEAVAREFMDGCMRKTGLTHEQALELWNRVSSFTGFSFCKSHSASYAQLSMQCTYLKAYYPAQFLASVISNNHGFYTRDIYLDEARRWGLRVLPIDINQSRGAYWGKHNWIRPGFMHIRNLRRTAREQIEIERSAGGPFHNLADFIKRVPIHRKEIESLILVGAFDGFGLTRPEHLYLLDGIYGRDSTNSLSLFDEYADLDREHLHPGLSDYTFAEKCFFELDLLGYMISGNILEILRLHPSSRGAVSAADIGKYAGQRIKVFGWPVTRRVHTVTRGRRAMMFLTIQDKSECADIVLWPDRYEQFHDILEGPGPYEIWGRVLSEHDTYSIEAEYLRSVPWSPGQIDLRLASEKLEKSFAQFEMYRDVKFAA